MFEFICMNGKRVNMPGCWLWLVLAVAILGGGCSGINATKSISPLDFFLPGLGMNDTGQPRTGDAQESLATNAPEALPLVAAAPAQ